MVKLFLAVANAKMMHLLTGIGLLVMFFDMIKIYSDEANTVWAEDC